MPRPRWARPCSSSFGTVDVLVNSAASTCRTSFRRLPSRTGTRFLQPISTAPITACAPFFPGCAAPDRHDRQHQLRRRQDGEEISGPAYVASKVRSAGPHAADQCRGTRERRAGCSICPRDVNTPLLDKRLQPPAPEVRAAMLARRSRRLRVARRDAPVARNRGRDLAVYALSTIST